MRKRLLTKPVAARARSRANSVVSNEARRQHQPTVVDWDKAITSLLDIFDGIYPESCGSSANDRMSPSRRAATADPK